MLKGFQNKAKMDAGAAVGSQLLDFGSRNLQTITKTASKISEISRLRRGCVFGAALGHQNAHHLQLFAHHLQLLGAIWRAFSTKSRKNGIQKGMQNSMSEKYRKLMAKGSQNDAKMDAKIFENSYFSETG